MVEHYLCTVCLRTLEGLGGPDTETVRDQFGIVASEIEFASCAAAYIFVAESPIQSIIHNFKYGSMPTLARSFGRSMKDLQPSNIDIVVPVPLHRTRMAERGYNQAEALAIGLAQNDRRRIVAALKRTRPTPSQTHLTIPERIENVRGAFALTSDAKKLRDKNILIVDDVMTTGSTLAAVAETLLSAHPKSVSTLTLAAAPRSF